METKQKRRKVVVSLLALVGLVVFSLTAGGGSLEPSAPPGPTMKTLDEVEPRIPIHASDLPLTISEPNSYYLAETINFTDDANNAITIEANNVTIDLMGYTLKGPDSGIGCGIYMYGGSSVEIHNGTVRDFGSAGICLYSDEWLSAKGHRVISVRAVSNGSTGIALYGSSHLVKDCTAAENGYNGIRVGDSSTVTGNTAIDNQFDGINTGWGATVSRNTANENQNRGIYTSAGSMVAGNTAVANHSCGIEALGNSTVVGNTARYNDTHGIYVAGGCLVTGNTAGANQNHGIYTTQFSTVSGNTACTNKNHGIRVSNDCTVRDNNCSQNGFQGVGVGIYVESNDNLIKGNNVVLNDTGIDVDGTGNLIVKNTAADNTTEYDIAGGNKVGTISADPTTAGPWDNFDF